jgi:estrogen-related receptor beta like 1
VKIKQAMNKLRNEITQMDTRTGVLQHILLQGKLKEKNEQSRSIGMVNSDQPDIHDYDSFKGF